jgi:hypothetical protein
VACCGRVSLLSLILSVLTVLVWSALLEKCQCLSLDQGWYVEVGSWHPCNVCFVVSGGNSDLIWTACFWGRLLLFILQSETCPMSFCFVILCPLSLSLEFGLLYRILQLPSWRMILIRSVAPKLAWQQDQHRWFHVQNQETDDSQKRSHQYQDTRTKNYWDLRQTDRVRVGICWFSFPWLVAWQFQNVSELYWLAGQYRSLCEHKVDTTCVKCAEQGNNRKERNKWISSAGICSHEWDSKSLAAKRKGQKWVAACSYTSWQARRNHGTSMLLNLAWDDTAGAMRNDAINNIQK